MGGGGGGDLFICVLKNIGVSVCCVYFPVIIRIALNIHIVTITHKIVDVKILMSMSNEALASELFNFLHRLQSCLI